MRRNVRSLNLNNGELIMIDTTGKKEDLDKIYWIKLLKIEN